MIHIPLPTLSFRLPPKKKRVEEFIQLFNQITSILSLPCQYKLNFTSVNYLYFILCTTGPLHLV